MATFLLILLGAAVALGAAALPAWFLYRHLDAEILKRDNRIEKLEGQVRAYHQQGLYLPPEKVAELPPEDDGLPPEVERFIAGFDDPEGQAAALERARYLRSTRPSITPEEIAADILSLEG